MNGGPAALARHFVAVTDEMPKSAHSCFSSIRDDAVAIVGLAPVTVAEDFVRAFHLAEPLLRAAISRIQPGVIAPREAAIGALDFVGRCRPLDAQNGVEIHDSVGV